MRNLDEFQRVGARRIRIDLVDNDRGPAQGHGAEAVAIYNDTAANFPNGTSVTTTNLIDALVYDVNNDLDDAGLLVLLTTGGQIDEGDGGNSAADSNQRCPSGSGSARDSTPYVGNQGAPSPGVANVCGDPIGAWW